MRATFDPADGAEHELGVRRPPRLIDDDAQKKRYLRHARLELEWIPNVEP